MEVWAEEASLYKLAHPLSLANSLVQPHTAGFLAGTEKQGSTVETFMLEGKRYIQEAMVPKRCREPFG